MSLTITFRTSFTVFPELSATLYSSTFSPYTFEFTNPATEILLLKSPSKPSSALAPGSTKVEPASKTNSEPPTKVITGPIVSCTETVLVRGSAELPLPS